MIKSKLQIFTKIFKKFETSKLNVESESNLSVETESQSVISVYSKIIQVFKDVNSVTLIENVEEVFKQKLIKDKKVKIKNKVEIYENIDSLIDDLNQDLIKMQLYYDIIERTYQIINLDVNDARKEYNLLQNLDIKAEFNLIHCHLLENIIVQVLIPSKVKFFMKQSSYLVEVNEDNLYLIIKKLKRKIEDGEEILQELDALLKRIEEKNKVIENNILNFYQLEFKLIYEFDRKHRTRKNWLFKVRK